jgi:hypothetical protein
MRLELRFDRGRCRRWMNRVVGTLVERKFDVNVRWVETEAIKPRGLDLLFDLERMLLRKGAAGGADPISPKEIGLVGPQADDATVVIDFSGTSDAGPTSGRRWLRPLYNGVAGEDGILAAALSGDLPCIEISDAASGEIVARGMPSAELAAGLSGALDSTMARTLTLLLAVLKGGVSSQDGMPRPVARQPTSAARHVLSGIASELVREIYRLCCYAPHWQVGWRFVDDEGVWQRGDLSGPAWNVIADPKVCFYADPFPITWQGRTFVFVEELDHRVGKGFISAIEFGADGPIGLARPVLEEPWHLSYPLLLEHGGDLWMVPESMANRDVAIYRCVEFPYRWERSATLLSDIQLSDATITQHDGRYYLFGALWDGAGGYSDTLAIFHAPDLFGPWHPHDANPVLVDRYSTRPGGNFVRRNGRLWRPIQDSTSGYGCGLVLAEVLELTPTTFRQRIHCDIKPGEFWPGRKLHTLNRAGRLEVIDGNRIQPKWTGLARGPRA